MRVVYLHGFASSPGSSKARFFRQKFEAHGVPIEIPQLDEGDFKGLTITRQLDVIDRAINGEPAVLMGSSLGGYLAALHAARNPKIEKLVLLAPAFQFPTRWRQRYTSEDLALWKQMEYMPVYHYGQNSQAHLGYQFFEDAQGYENEPEFKQRALILHGSEDTIVPVEVSKTFALRRPHVQLQVLRSGHELTDVLDQLWDESAEFLGLGKG